MAIQMRRGLLANYDESKMVAGELAVTTDATTEDQQVFVAFAAGVSKRILTDDDLAQPVQNVWTGSCSTAASTAEKSVTLDNPNGFSLTNGTTIIVRFVNSNTATSPTLNVNGLGALSIYFVTGRGALKQVTSKPYCDFGDYQSSTIFTYYNDRWVINQYDTHAVNAIIPTGGYATCNTPSSTYAKVAYGSYLDNYTLTPGAVIAVKFTYDLLDQSASITLKVEATDAKSITLWGSQVSLPVDLIKAGDVAFFLYNGSSYVYMGRNRPYEGVAVTVTDPNSDGHLVLTIGGQ